MTNTEKRIEMVKLLARHRQGDDKPGTTILRALRELDRMKGDLPKFSGGTCSGGEG